MILEQLDPICKYKRSQIRPHLTPYIYVNSWIINLHVKPKTVKLLEENIRENLCDFGFGRVPDTRNMKRNL